MPETMLCSEAASAYFQKSRSWLRRKVRRRAGSERTRIVYLYVTWLIERRALDVYGRYKEALGASALSTQLEALLDEEVGHLRQVEAGLAAGDPDHAARAPALEAFEHDLFETFVGALAEELQPAQPHA